MNTRSKFLASLVASCTVSLGCAAQSPIKVGLITSLSGPIASVGIPLARGLNVGLTQFPKIDGHRVELVLLDDASDSSAATRNARKMIDESNVDAIIGCAGSPSTATVAEVSYEKKVPMIAVAPIALGGERGSWHIIVPVSVNLMLAADVAHMKKTGVKTVAYIGFNDAWGDLAYKALKKAADAESIEIVANERFSRADTSVTAQILKIIATRPDAVLTGGAGTPGALPHIALAQHGYRGPVYATPAIISPDFVRVGGSAVEGVVAPALTGTVADQLPNDNPIKAVAMKFRASYQKLFRGPNKDIFSPIAYDAYLIFVNAAERALKTAKPGTAEFRLAIRDAMTRTQGLVGATAVYNYRPGTYVGADERALVLVRLRRGRWKVIH
jgi:branched-chain amino acid transport system substrate-binding protein